MPLAPGTTYEHTHSSLYVKSGSYQRGHYPYAVCDNASATKPRRAPRYPITLLMAASREYREVVPSWAAQARQAGLACALGSIGLPNSSACAAAVRHGCRCLIATDGSRAGGRGSESDKLASNWQGNRAHSVRQRFVYALRLAKEGYSVLMHDGDVFYRPGGLPRLVAFLATVQHSMEVAILHNGARKEIFDDLNWGVVWLSGSRRTRLLLECLLASWDHAAFQGTGSYFRRSQPRVNHLLERHFESTPRDQQMRLCTLPRAVAHASFAHMSGHTLPRSKMICAVAGDVLASYVPEKVSATVAEDAAQPSALSYVAPVNATLLQQQAALSAAIRVARASGRALALPTVRIGRSAKRAPFCSVFDPVGFPPQAAVLPSGAPCEATVTHGAAALAALDSSSACVAVSFGALLDVAKQMPAGQLVGMCPNAPARCTASSKGSRHKPGPLLRPRRLRP